MNFNPEDYRSLNNDELIQEGDVQKNLEEGAYFLISTNVIHGLVIGCRVGMVRGQWAGFNDILRKL